MREIINTRSTSEQEIPQKTSVAVDERAHETARGDDVRSPLARTVDGGANGGLRRVVERELGAIDPLIARQHAGPELRLKTPNVEARATERAS